MELEAAILANCTTFYDKKKSVLAEQGLGGLQIDPLKPLKAGRFDAQTFSVHYDGDGSRINRQYVLILWKGRLLALDLSGRADHWGHTRKDFETVLRTLNLF